MTNTELINIYETTYKEEFDKHFEMVNTLSEQARDKKYALQFGLGIMTLMLAFRNSFEIEKEIMQAFEHHFKLGGSVADTIRSIPDIIERHKKVAKECEEMFGQAAGMSIEDKPVLINFRVEDTDNILK